MVEQPCRKIKRFQPWQGEFYERLFLRNAEIAQLVEHNLAKVGVASSSLVFRSIEQRKADAFSKSPGGGMVDALVSGASVERRAGSSPVLGTGTARRILGLEKWRNW